MPSTTPPHPPDETRDQLAAALRRNHPEMSDAQIDRLLSGEPAKRRHNRRRLAGVKTRSGGGTVGSAGLPEGMRPRRRGGGPI